MIWGVFVRLLGWPLGYWLVARGSMRTVVVVEVTSNLLMALLPVLLLPAFGLTGTAIGYFIGYLVYAVAMLALARRRSGAWLSTRTLLCFGGATILLLGAEGFAMLTHGGYWGMIPTGLVALGSVLVYRKAASANP
jgi:O-antigen/teichoic acid export membrane protein